MSSYSPPKIALRPSVALGDSSRRRTALLKDGSWIKKDVEEDESVDRDPNFGRSVLGRLKSLDDTDSKPVEKSQTSPVRSTNSVGNLTKRFGGSQELLNQPSATTAEKTPTGVKTSTTTTAQNITTTKTSSIKPPIPAKSSAVRTASSTSFTERVFSDAKSNNKIKNFSPAKRPQSVSSPVAKEFPKDSINGVGNKTASPEPPPAVTTPTTMKSKPLSPDPVLFKPAPVETSVTSSTEKTVQSSVPESFSKSQESSQDNTEPVKTQSSYSSGLKDPNTLDSLADTLLPTFSDTTQLTPASPTKSTVQTVNLQHTSTKDNLTDTKTTTPSKTVYTSPVHSPAPPYSTRTAANRDVCTYCRQPIVGGAKMILDDLQIFSHTSCFKCAVCHCDLGDLEAGESLWVHKNMVNCESCFKATRDQWFR